MTRARLNSVAGNGYSHVGLGWTNGGKVLTNAESDPFHPGPSNPFLPANPDRIVLPHD